MDKLLFSFCIILSALALGYTLRQLDERRLIRLVVPIADLRKLLQKIGLLFFMPVSFMTAVWIVKFSDLRVALLPLMGVSALILGGVLGLILARLTRAAPQQTGVLFCCTSFTNIGAIGGLICFMFLGEPGFALVGLYKMFEEIMYYGVGFPIARYYSGMAGSPEQTLPARIAKTVSDPLVATILVAFFTGLTLNLLGVVRPAVFGSINALFVPAGTFVLITSIGLGMRFSRIRNHLRYGMAVTCTKSLIVPLCITGLAWTIGLGEIDHGLPLKVVIVLSSMPVAFNSLVAASLFDLDLDLANSCWLISTLSLVFVLPALFLLVNHF